MIWWQWGGQYGGEYFAGYITEKALSVDNLFVFTVIMASFAVPRAYQQKLLLIGIVMALVMRAGFIALGAAAINTFSWVFYLFGLFLILTALKLARESGHEREAEVERENRLVTPGAPLRSDHRDYDGDKFITRIDGKRAVTPMMLALVAIGFTDLLFALDSIPAIYGLTEEPYIVFTANAFALMGLRQLYFLIGGLLDRLIYLSVGPVDHPRLHRHQADAACAAQEHAAVHQQRQLRQRAGDLDGDVDQRDRCGAAHHHSGQPVANRAVEPAETMILTGVRGGT